MRTRGNKCWVLGGDTSARLVCTPKELIRLIRDTQIQSVQTVGKTGVDLNAYLDSVREVPVRRHSPEENSDRQRDGAPLGWSLAGILTLVSVAGASWGMERLHALAGQLVTAQDRRAAVEDNLTSARRDHEYTQKLLEESRAEIDHLNDVLTAAGQDVARRDAVTQSIQAKLKQRNQILEARNQNLESQVSDLEEALSRQAKADVQFSIGAEGNSSTSLDAPTPEQLPETAAQLSPRD